MTTLLTVTVMSAGAAGGVIGWILRQATANWCPGCGRSLSCDTCGTHPTGPHDAHPATQ